MPVVNSTYTPSIEKAESTGRRVWKSKYQKKTPSFYITYPDGSESKLMSATILKQTISEIARGNEINTFHITIERP